MTNRPCSYVFAIMYLILFVVIHSDEMSSSGSIYITEKEGPQKTPIGIMKKSQCGNLIAI